MDRGRYEAPDNFWQPFMFAPETMLGSMQDTAYGFWNWGVRCVYDGPWHMRIFVLMLNGFAGMQFLMILPQWVAVIVQRTSIGQTAASIYHAVMPESLLLPEQLILAQKQ